MSKSRISKVFRWVVAGGIAFGAVYYFVFRGGNGAEPVSFRLAKIDRGPVEETVTATGSVNAVVTVQVGTQVSGTIQRLYADFNSKVTAGQIVAQIDPTRFRANLDQAEASLKAAQAAAARSKVMRDQASLEKERAEELARRGVMGQADLDAARSKLDQTEAEQAASQAQMAQARASIGVAKVDLEHTTIKAPISGTVLQRAVDVGQTVAASLQAPTLFTIAEDLSRMEVRAAVDEADVGKLKEGQEARFSVDAYPGQEFRATIFQIRSQPNVQQNVVTYDAILRLENKDGKLRPGMTATVRVISQRKEGVLRAPNAALRFKPAPELIEGPAAGSKPGGLAMAEPGRPPGAGGVAAGGAAAGGPARGGFAAAPARGPGMGGPPGGFGAEGGRRGGRSQARVFQPRGSKVAAMPFKPGIADDEFTEIAGGPLKEGDEVVVDATGGPQRSMSPAQNPMRGRGPRFF